MAEVYTVIFFIFGFILYSIEAGALKGQTKVFTLFLAKISCGATLFLGKEILFVSTTLT